MTTLNKNVLNFIRSKTLSNQSRFVEKDNTLYLVADTGRGVAFEPIMIRVNDRVFGNSSQLQYAEQHFGRFKRWGDTKLQQSIVAAKVPMIPFSVFVEAKIDINKLQIIEAGKAETVKERIANTKKYRNVHFTGALLFQIESKCFLFDIDRREVHHGILNPFLVELKTHVKTIAEAYDSLKPEAVKDAEAKGLKVKRQGEWFFIPLKNKPLGTEAKSSKERWASDSVTYELRAGNNRPNIVSHVVLGAKKTILACKGKIEHSGREHADLVLTDWHRPVPNTSIASFTLQGRVD